VNEQAGSRLIHVRKMTVGVVADTHGHLDERLLAAFRGVDAVLHAGDVGSEAVLAGLGALAPLHAVCGNNDERLGCLGLPFRVDLELGGVRIHLVHRLIDATPPAETEVVVFGHSHQQLAEERQGRLYLNPGAAGRQGFHRLQTAALLRIEGGRATAELVALGPRY
jgi:hypothetical protein